MSIILAQMYTVNHKKVEPFYFCNNFVKYQHTWIIFGTRVVWTILN